MNKDINSTVPDQGKAKSFIRVFCEIFSRLPARRRRQFWLLFVYMLFASAVATIAVGSIALFAAAFSSPERILDSKYIVIAQNIFQADFLRSQKGILIFLSFLMVFLIVIKNALENLLLYYVAHFGAAVEAHFGTVLLRGFLHMPYEWHINRNSADLILALQWRSHIGHSFFNTALTAMSDTLLVLFLILTVFLVNPYISLVVFVVSAATAYFSYNKIHRLQEREARKCREYDLSINRQVTKGIHGIKDVKVSGKTSFLTDFEKDAYDLANIQGMRAFFAKLPVGLLEVIGFAVLSGAIIFMLFFTKSSTIQITAVISLLIVAAWRILPAVSRIMGGFIAIRNILPYIQMEIDYIKDIETNATYPPPLGEGSFQDLKFDNEIQLKNIHFSYQGRESYVLEDIGFSIKKGQTVGVIGYSGVGKSTLVDIIIGLLKPDKGKITVDGDELDISKRYLWMKKIGYVPQTPYIFDGSVAENIAFGMKAREIDRDFVLECCRMAYMQDILDILPNGIDTLIGERGVRLSGGQRQRVAIARSLYTRPELMIFDEATSSLDRKSEKAIQDSIYALKGKKTLLIVAHRLKTVENCDFLVWLEAGQTKMIGTPEGILRKYEESLH